MVPLGDPELLGLQGRIPQGVLFKHHVARPLCRRGEIEIERLSRGSDPFAVGQNHLAPERPCSATDHRDPVAASILDAVRIIVNVNVRKDAEHFLYGGSMYRMTANRSCV